MLLLKGTKDAYLAEKGKKPSKYRTTTLQIKGSSQTFNMPTESSTTVKELMSCVSSIFAYKRGTSVKAFSSAGKELDGFDSVGEEMTIEGLEDFKHPRYTWPHPVAIIGCGFFGVKT